MTLPIGATPAFAAGAMKGGGCVVPLVGTFTTSTGVFTASTAVESQKEYSLGSFTLGLATLTFPKNLAFLFGHGEHDTDNSSAASRYYLRVGSVNLAAGTATVRIARESDGATDSTHSAPTGTIKLMLWTGD